MTSARSPSRRRHLAVLSAILVAAALPWSPGPAQAAPEGGAPAAAGDVTTPPAWKKSRDEVAAKLLAFAKSTKAKGCIREARAAFEAIVALDPEHTEARHSLGHEKKGGRWYAAATPKMPDSPAKLVDEVEAARKAIVGPFVVKALAVATAAGNSIEVREMAAADAVAADPGSPDARKANREVEDGGKWLLEETVAARARRAELAAVFQTKFDATPAPTLEPAEAGEVDVLGAGATATRAHFGRVAGSAGNVETADVARLQPGLELVFRKAVAEPRPLRRLKVHLFPDPATGIAAIQKDARFDMAAKDMAMQLGATWVPGTLDYWVYGQTPEGRRETAMRGAVGTWLFWAYKVDAKRGWALEGVNHWCSEVTLASHRVAYLRPSEYAGSPLISALTDKLRAEGANWMQLASELAASDEWPGVRSILAKDVNNLGPEGMLLSYVLARYVIEGKPGVAADVLTAVGNIEAPDAWMTRLLGMSPEGLDRRIRRWTGEVAALPSPAAPTPTPPQQPPAPPKDPKAPGAGQPPAPPKK